MVITKQNITDEFEDVSPDEDKLSEVYDAAEMTNERYEVPTFQADGIMGVMYGPGQAKFSLVEYFLVDGAAKCRYVANIVMPRDQIGAIGELFTRVQQVGESSSETAAAEDGVAADGE